MDDFQAVEPTHSDLLPVTQNPAWECLQCAWQVRQAYEIKDICEKCDGKMARVDDILAGRV
jgi:Zn finger protein HypA/HybF involved in hydrogenase expression